MAVPCPLSGLVLARTRSWRKSRRVGTPCHTVLGAAWGWVLVSPAPVQIWGRGCGVRLLWQKLCEGLDPSITCNVDCVNNPGGYDCEKVGARATSAPGLSPTLSTSAPELGRYGV